MLKRLASLPLIVVTNSSSSSTGRRCFAADPALRTTPLPPSTDTSSHSTRFWSHDVPSVALTQLKAEHGAARTIDRRSRFKVRDGIRRDGVISNFFPLYYPEDGDAALSKAPLYIYEMRATRTLSQRRESKRKRKKGSEDEGDGDGDSVRGIHPSAMWDAVCRYFNHIYLEFPPIVRLQAKLYSPTALSEEALKIPTSYHDLGWDSCSIELVGKYSYASLPDDELQQLVNKIVPWCIRRHPSHEVVREAKGKFVSVELGLRANGVRVYQGVMVHAQFVDASNSETQSDASQESSHSVLPSTDLIDATEGGENAIRFTVHEFIRSFEYRGKSVESYKVEDASGIYLASLWEPATPQALHTGSSYSARKWKLKVFPDRNHMRLFEFHPETHFTLIVPPIAASQSEKEVAAASEEAKEQSKRARHQLALKIDAKGTVASELSLWEEVKQQFGPGPYDLKMKEQIKYAVEGTPVVSSVALSQGIVRSICYDVSDETEEGRFARQFLPREAVKLLGKIDQHQPFALLQTGSLWPMQALHCCFDPRMKSWQDVAIASLSLFPAKRAVLLSRFRSSLETTLRTWGLQLTKEPLRTKALSLLSAPQKTTDRSYQYQKDLAHPFPRAHPSTVVVIGILGSDSALEDRVKKSSLRIGAYFKTQLVTTVSAETEAVQYMVDQLTTRKGNETVVKDPNSAAIIVTLTKDSKAVRWLCAECLSRGVLPITVNAPKSPKNQGLLCGNLKRRIMSSFESDPLFGINLYHEVPSINGKYLFFVGIDTCHTMKHSAGSLIGILCTPHRNHLFPLFWRNDSRGSEVGHVVQVFHEAVNAAKALYNRLDEIVVFQDGDVFSTVEDLHEEVKCMASDCGYTFLCLHKRGNVRFIHQRGDHSSSPDLSNVVKGTIIQDITPVMPTTTVQATTAGLSSFYLLAHDGNMSTSRIVHYTIHHASESLSIPVIQQLSNAMSNVMSPQPTKLPMPTRCAHRLADKAERLIDAVPLLRCEMIPSPLRERLWFF